jgi:hypothetical protein
VTWSARPASGRFIDCCCEYLWPAHADVAGPPEVLVDLRPWAGLSAVPLALKKRFEGDFEGEAPKPKHGIETSSSPCPDTSFRVVYRRPDRGNHLVARLDYFQYEQKGPITRAQFLARARKLANTKARELGWIV